MADTDIQKLLARLTRLRTEDHRIVSCYLKVEPRDRARGKYLIKLKNRIRQMQAGLADVELDRTVQAEVAADMQRILEALSDPKRLPATQGVAVFACGPLKLFELVALPTVHRSRLGVERSALVRELAAIEDEFGQLLTVVLDRTAARFFEVTAFGTTEIDGLRAAETTRGSKNHGSRQGPHGQGEHTYNSRIREEKQRHFAAIAQHLFELHRRRPVHGIVLAGTGREAGAVTAFLHPYLAERLMGVVSLNPKQVKPALVHEVTLATREEFERELERSIAHAMKDATGDGWAVDGLAETLEALGKGQVRTLLVDVDAQGTGYRSGKTGRLALSERELRADGEVRPVIDVVDEAIEEALRQRVEVQVVYDESARASIDGLAGLLRFR